MSSPALNQLLAARRPGQTLISVIEQTAESLDQMPIARRIEVLRALRELAVSREERASIDTQLAALGQAEEEHRHHLQLLRTRA